MTKERVLTLKAKGLLSESAEQRIAHIRKSVFLSYPRAEELLQEMAELLHLPKSDRPPNMLVVARSNNGKTHILKEFLRRNEPDERPSGDVTYAPVVYVQAPPKPDNRQFMDSALRVFNIEARRSATDTQKLQLVIDQLRACETKVLMIDEIHSILAGPIHQREAVLNTLKYLSNESGVSIVAAGTRVARDALLNASELKSRFPRRYLTPWTVNKEFRDFLSRLESTLPLREESQLYDAAMSQAIFGISDESIGGAVSVVREAAIKALRSGQEKITLDLVESMHHKLRREEEEGARL